MTKTHHRTFEMYDFAEEAENALASKSARLQPNSDDPQVWALRHFVASRSSGIIHMKFVDTELLGEEAAGELRDNFSELAEQLVNGSRVLIDFEGLLAVDAEFIAELATFNRKLQAKASRVVLCNLDEAVQDSFFPHRKPSP
jgi:hypothetical protein